MAIVPNGLFGFSGTSGTPRPAQWGTRDQQRCSGIYGRVAGVKRDGVQARNIVAKVGNPDVTGRRLERWSAAKLLPPGTPDEATLLAHVAALADAAPPGRDPDTVALIMAARGFGCARYPESLARNYGAESLGALAADFAQGTHFAVVDPTTDDGSRAIDQRATFIDGVVATDGPLPLPAEALRALLRDANQKITDGPPIVEDSLLPTAGPHRSDGSPIPASPEQVAHTMLVGLMMLFAGGCPTTFTAIAVGSGAEQPSPSPTGDQEQALALFSGAIECVQGLMANLTQLPLEALVFGAQAMRLILRAAGVDALLAERTDRLAGMLAPVGVAFSPLLFHVFKGDGLLPAQPDADTPPDDQKPLVSRPDGA